MSTNLTHHFGLHDYHLGEARNLKVHVYPTKAAADADVANSVARIIYVADTQRFYIGRPSIWTGLGTGSYYEEAVADPTLLPVGPTIPIGQVRIVLDDPVNNHLPNLFQFDGTTWHRICDDVRVVFLDGSRKFTGIPGVTDALTVIPVVPADLTTKKYVDDAITGLSGVYVTPAQMTQAFLDHEAEVNPHAQYSTIIQAQGYASDALSAAQSYADGLLTVHLAALDPHPQYTTAAEAAAAAAPVAASAVSAHDGNVSAHIIMGWQNSAQVLTSISIHNTDPSAHGGGFHRNRGMIDGFQTSNLDKTDIFVTTQRSMTAGVARIWTSVNHNFTVGEAVAISGLTDTTCNGTFIIVACPSSDSFTISTGGGSYGITADTGGSCLSYSPNAISISLGMCSDSTNSTYVETDEVFVKYINASWVQGSYEGGLDTGVVAPDTWYHLFVICDDEGSVFDFMFSLSLTPAVSGQFTRWRRILSVRTDAFGSILPYTQTGDNVEWCLSKTDYSASPGAGAVLYTLTVPSGVKTKPFVSARAYQGGGTLDAWVSSPDALYEQGELRTRINDSEAYNNFFGTFLTTDTSSRIRVKTVAGAELLELVTQGWRDFRGQE